MGVCVSDMEGDMYDTPEKQDEYRRETVRSKELSKDMKREKISHRKDMSMLLLGPGDSGKSTILKQMVHLYGDGFDEDKRTYFKYVVYDNVIECAQELIRYSRKLSKTVLNEQVVDCSLQNPEAEKAARMIMKLKKRQETEVTRAISAHLKLLWNDPGIQNTRLFGNKFNILDNAEHFFNKLEVLADKEYVPTYDDVLRTRNRTSGIVETTFVFQKYNFKVFDVGGQRNERRKWIHCFEGVRAVIFITAISEYDQMLFEDPNVHRIDEALELFDELCHSRWFLRTAMILFLNKHDLFCQKLQVQPLSVYPGFTDYDGPDPPSEDDALNFFRDKFLQSAGDERDVYVHVTNATDTEKIGRVFDTVKDLSIRLAMRDWGWE